MRRLLALHEPVVVFLVLFRGFQGRKLLTNFLSLNKIGDVIHVWKLQVTQLRPDSGSSPKHILVPLARHEPGPSMQRHVLDFYDVGAAASRVQRRQLKRGVELGKLIQVIIHGFFLGSGVVVGDSERPIQDCGLWKSQLAHL